MDRNDYRNTWDSMTGMWAELRDLAEDSYTARQVIGQRLHMMRGSILDQAATENVLLYAVILLVRENEQLRKHAIRFATLAVPAQHMPAQNEQTIE